MSGVHIIFIFRHADLVLHYSATVGCNLLSGDFLYQLFPCRVPYNVLRTERHADERHGLPGISQHKTWQPKDGSSHKYFIVRSHRVSKTQYQFFRNPCAPPSIGEWQSSSWIGWRRRRKTRKRRRDRDLLISQTSIGDAGGPQSRRQCGVIDHRGRVGE